ncbi:MAG: ABC transporter permease subunit [Desulfobacteraceae bacterium]|jgi:putative spermidine/putrescine transport system permease protein|nr:ABC transporter permease subunit [Desulfobacteraceae bacterium]MBC2751458.1 ABC transporter permease subunit [Desulfobacteraceae bacterium]
MAVMTGIYLLYLFIPILLLFVGSFGEAWTNTLLPTGLTGAWYLELWQDGSFRRAFTVSLEVVVATCVFCTLLAVPLAYALYRSASRGVMVAARIVFLLPIAAPPLVLAFGFILIFSTDALPWLGSIWLLIAGHVVLTLPYLLQTLVADMRHLRLEELELAAESLGATFRERFMDVVVPLLRHSLGSGLIMVAALSIGEFQLSNLISGFLYRPYPVVLLQAFYGSTGFACAATVILLGLALLAAAGGALAARSASKYRKNAT